MKNIVLLITDTFRYDNLGERAEKPIRTQMLSSVCGSVILELFSNTKTSPFSSSTESYITRLLTPPTLSMDFDLV